MSDTFVPPEIMAGGSTSSSGYNLRPLSERTPAEAVQMVDKWFHRSVENRQHVENQALLNLSFFLGQQYVRIDGTALTSRVVPVAKRKGQVRTVDNVIEPAVRSELSRLLRTRPFGTVIPQGDDAADHEAARAADQTVEHVMREGGWEKELQEAALWSIIAGTGHVGTSWEENQSDSFGQKGLVIYRSLSPFEFAVPNLRRSNIQDQPYVMVTKAYEVDEIEQRWGVRVSADREEQYGSYDERLNGIITGRGRNATYGSGGTENRVPVAIVKEVWVRPSMMAPEGAVIIVASGQLLQYSPTWPKWCNGQYPFAKIDYTDIPGAYWSKAMVSDLIPLQRRHNRAASSLVELMNLITHTTVSVPRGTKVKQILGGRGTMLETPAGMSAPATQMRVDSAGNLPLMELEETRKSVRDISHQHEVTKGSTPPNVRSGTAIASLKELDDAAAAIPIRNIERATESMGRHSLNLAREKWTEDRMVLVLGTSGAIEQRSFVNSNGLGGQYWVQPGSAWPFSKAQRQSMIFDFFDRGLMDPGEVMRHAEVGTPHSVRMEREIDYRHARRENQKFEDLSAVGPDGMVSQQSMQMLMQTYTSQLLPAEWHNHAEHLKVHNNLRKSPIYEKWEPWRRELFEAHISGHRAALEQQLLMAAQGPGAGMTGEAQQAAGKRETAAAASQRMDEMQGQQAAQQQQQLDNALRLMEAQAKFNQAQQGNEPAAEEE